MNYLTHTSMMINNVIISSVKKEKNNTYQTSNKIKASNISSIGSKEYLANIKSVIGAEVSDKSIYSSKLVESLDIKTTKSTLLKEIISKCKDFDTFNKCKEGDLLKIDKVNLRVLDEETLRQILIFRRNALQGLKVEGVEINNIISSMLQDYSYILKGQYDNSEDAIIFKIPMEIESEFESKYNFNDLLIGNVSVVGVYKGTVTEDFIKTNTFSYFTNLGTLQQEPERKVFLSSAQINEPALLNPTSLESTKEIKYNFIDIIAVIQDIHFKQQQDDAVAGQPWYKCIFNFFHRWRQYYEQIYNLYLSRYKRI